MSQPRALSLQTRKVLSALLDEGRSGAHGYEIIQRVGIKSGTLYPLLMRLADQGFLEAEWRAPEVAGRPPRQVYRLTASGVELARRNLPEPHPSVDPLSGAAPA
ncbi:PadR family transcriptional regulator [Sphingomonas radiodurans]|uniref:PadR family transcriptional regulator n=1 Tax=Sphingomonas radiodurans TaxID=2890321 RepID=UPI001E61556E|nr:PadR family transcriptional regulator [Sphingomonas radiodurans]WBH17989.1 PadR family transcriptional regulator [Sphingomonas radiodurans]